ncbi:D-proline reductase (dithiol) PrdD [Halanaerobium sp. MA284_MarDTE_T2]|nr:D-proline reductase (dithiol) PrdD [Halanaerobium sp. MA284_MarDTE_T2]RCW84917.1 D-proline reductase (dithiol) PrdD [Halanaerobium sp. DL-01]
MSGEKRKLTIKAFNINKVELGSFTEIKDNVLKLDREYLNKIDFQNEIIKDINLKIISPDRHDQYVNNILDFIPISVKALGNLGTGITHTLTGVYLLLSCADEKGRQMAEFGSSEGILSDRVIFGRAGTPAKDDYIINFEVIVKEKYLFERKAAQSVHAACDNFLDLIREKLKNIDGRKADEIHKYEEKINPDKKKIVLVKQVAGQGAMYDNQILADEPSGFKGGRSIIDMGNMPVILSPNEYRDGAIRAMT